MNPVPEVITVSELNRKARLAIEKSLPSCWVSGEISNFTHASSGHWYFTLKDAQSSVKCAFFRNKNQFTDWRPSEGDHIEVRAQATLYEPRGDYQLVVDAMRRSGQGTLFEAFLRLKSKLAGEGLFDEALKRQLPICPNTIGIVTSLQAAALHDALRTLQTRWPLCHVVIYPCAVQGPEAAQSIMDSLREAQMTAMCDVLLLIRGGGSLEDLNAYNDEKLARCIRSSAIPVIAGIGHETDFSIADFVADRRAATPTAAAQIAVPDKTESYSQITQLHIRSAKALQNRLNQNMQFIDGMSRRLVHPGERVKRSNAQINQLAKHLTLNMRYRMQRHMDALLIGKSRLTNQHPDFEFLQSKCSQSLQHLVTSMAHQMTNHRNRLIAAHNSLQQLNPGNILARGYCVAQDSCGRVLTSASSVHPGAAVRITFKVGQLETMVTRVFEEAE